MPLEILVREVVVGFGGRLDHLLAPFLGLGEEIRRDVAHLELHALRGVVPVDRLHAHEIDDSLEFLLRTDRNLDRHRIALQARLDVPVRLEEVGALPIHLVDEREARHAVLVRLAPHRFGLRLHACNGVIDHARAVEHPHRTLDLDGEIDVPRRVDDVDAVLGEVLVHPLPEAGRRGRGDRDAALALLLHPVHDRCTVVDFAHLVRDAGVEKDALRGRGLAGIDMGTDADVAVTLDGGLAGHLQHLGS